MSHPATLALPLAALALSACAAAISSSPAPAQVGPAPQLCTGLAHCRAVASVDVDGDDRPDQVGVAASRPQHGGSITVRVLTATGHRLQTTGRHVFWYTDAFLGSPQLDGEPGAELVVGDSMGAHTQQTRVVTYRQGRLVTLPEPPLVWTAAGLADSTPRWTVDGAWSGNLGVSRTSSAADGVRLTLKSAIRHDSGTGHTGHTTVYRWQGGSWEQVSSRRVRYTSDAAAGAVGGWHVPGLARFVG